VTDETKGEGGLYVAAGTGSSGHVAVVDVSSPTAPTYIGSIDLVGSALGVDVIVAGARAYVTQDSANTGTGGPFEVVDLSCPSCSDGVQNAMETDVDCGGPTCSPCALAK
jgi:hypothetical protein